MRNPCLVRDTLASVLLVAVCGCAGPIPIGPDATLAASPRPYEPDLPVPVGFRLVDRSSEDWSGGATRYLRHRYGGRADKYAVRRFYQEQMPLVRWTKISDGNVDGRITMRFRRGAESCTVTIDDKAGGWSHRVAVDILITPSAPTDKTTSTDAKVTR